MDYTIKELSKIAGVSSRTLRYYDEIDLLKPCRVNSSGYRIYSGNEVDLLQQILFYRELDLPLNKIKEIISKDNFDYKKALYEHKENIIRKQQRFKIILENIEKTIETIEGEQIMKDEEKFIGFKEELVKENDKKYGKELRKKYGEEVIEKSNENLLKLSKEEFYEVEKIGKEINEKLNEALKIGDSTSEIAMEVVRLHKKWLSYYGNYSKEAHIELGEMYVYDERFNKFYTENVGCGAAEFLKDAIIEFYK
ncbi:MerR family transcriptional regulator [Clostridium botulinum]|uniref:Transcriptional activator TipA n=1 Tax=Clostridium botulinum (strain Eklund 17B / Type B) TaxID=935198 RepID=B2TMQ3_CLOBB|nr:transcriptional activator TipA [Clostridium botulinum B str. Eklund 17B (NRP)]MBY6977184.1 MerR family transcriptional regulator [Clostridium botulinum]MBY6999340.1 MerR family transcriptional regulator [Clostridium botulinum]MCR1272575.1 MerR family transcriptional regulator [Clostridium botulinum]NFD70047.1 MerR family transcriptional regulator [Clostridium botulinum]